MAYIALADLKAYLFAGGQVPPVTDDVLLTSLAARAQAIIERKTTRTFESRVETRLYDLPRGRSLRLDDDLLSVTTLTNGDGSVIASTEYHLKGNYVPYRVLVLNQGSTATWFPGTNGNIEKVISVAGTWGYMAAPNDDVKQTTTRLADWLYRMKDSMGNLDRVIHAPDGSTIMPSSIPTDVEDMINDLMPKF